MDSVADVTQQAHPLSKIEVICAMALGARVRHRSFTEGESMRLSGNRYKFEDGSAARVQQFWDDRKDESWREGWMVLT